MHYHLEIIMPPTDDVEAAVKTVMAPFYENNEDARHAFWNWWEIGGRYSGSKVKCRASPEAITAFIDELNRRGVTVSSFTFGKQEIKPASQIPAVDDLWREMCPGAGDVCPLFQHSGESSTYDVCSLAEMPEGLAAFHVIIAAPGYEGGLEAEHMMMQRIWNGVNFQETSWDGNVLSVVRAFLERIEDYGQEYRAKVAPRPDWMVVTVDYHS